MKALLLTKSDDKFEASVQDVEASTLLANTADANVLIKVQYSTLNYKDGLAITNKSPVVRKWPMIAGIDAAGTVLQSNDERFVAGDAVILNGWGVGETHWGGLAEQARFKADWLVKLPGALTTRQAMQIGTAGYTAMLCALALEAQGVKPEHGEILVTGAAGGVGSVAIAILSGWGYRVVASTGRPEQAQYLQELGASEIIDRAQLSAPGKPLQKERWAGVVDSVGSHTLANACAQMRYKGVVTACGLAQGMDFPASVAPFILRGVRLVGIDSVMCPMADRARAWHALASRFDASKLDAMTSEISLSEVVAQAATLMSGQVRGRTVVKL